MALTLCFKLTVFYINILSVNGCSLFVRLSMTLHSAASSGDGKCSIGKRWSKQHAGIHKRQDRAKSRVCRPLFTRSRDFSSRAPWSVIFHAWIFHYLWLAL